MLFALKQTYTLAFPKPPGGGRSMTHATGFALVLISPTIALLMAHTLIGPPTTAGEKAVSMLNKMLRCLHWIVLASAIFLTACDSVEERAQEYYDNGVELLEMGNAEKAAIEFRNAVELDGEFVEARMELAKIQEHERRFSSALQNYLKILETDPNHVDALVRAANIMIVAGHIDRGMENIDRAYKLAPDDVRVLVTRSVGNLRLGNYEEAVKNAEKALTKAPAEPRAGLVLASDQLHRGNIKEAEAIVNRFLEVNPDDVSLNVLRIRVLEQIGDKEKLVAHLRKMIQLYPDSLEVRRVLARWYVAEKDLPNAEAQLRKLHELQPESTEALRNLIQFVTDTRGEAAAMEEVKSQIARAENATRKVPLQILLAEMYYDSGDPEAAHSLLDSVIADEGQDSPALEARLLLGQFKAREQKFDEALAAANSVLAVDQKNAIALGLRAAIHSDQGNHEQAVIDVRAALNENPRNVKLRRLAARIYDRNGNNELAMESLATAVVLSGYDPQYVQEYAAALRNASQPRAIEAVLSEAARRHPKNRDLLAALAAARLRLEDWAGAEQAAAALRAVDTGDSADRIRAVVLTGQQRYGESIKLLERLAQSDEQNASIMAALTQVYIQSGQTEQARAYINNVLKKDPENAAALRISGALHALNGDLKSAEESFRAAVLAQPDEPIGFLVLSRFLLDHDRPAESEEIVRAGIANVPGNIGLHIQLADLLLQRGEFEPAIREFEAVYDLQPNSLVAANNLASMLADFHANNPELMNRAYAIAQRLAGSDNPAHMDTYGWILYLRGEYALALRSLRPAAQQLPDDPWVQYHAGMVYSKLNQVESARRHLQAALDAGGERMFPLRDQAKEALDALPSQ